MKALAVAAAVLALAAGGCGGDGKEERPAAPTVAPAPAPEGGLTVEEALATEAKGLLLVRGYLFREHRGYRLCDAVLESNPPQCGGASVPVEGAPEESGPGAPVSLVGELRDGVLHVKATALPGSVER